MTNRPEFNPNIDKIINIYSKISESENFHRLSNCVLIKIIFNVGSPYFNHQNTYLQIKFTSPAVVAQFVKESVFHSVNSAPSANSGLNPAWECCIDRLNLKEFVAIQIARRRVLFGGFTHPRATKQGSVKCWNR